LSENISAVDWFTKKRINNEIDSEQIDTLLDKLVKDIINAFNELSRIDKIADKIAYILENNPLIRDISSDSRLPVCSLLHHIKIKSGIAVCLLLQEMDCEPDYIPTCLGEYGIVSNYEEKDLVALVRIASLLHNIGKPKYYTSASKDQESHHYTKKIIDRILSETKSSLVNKMELRKALPLLASVHNSSDDITKLEEIIYEADTVASAADKIYDVKGTYNDGSVVVECNDKIFPHEIDFNAAGLICRDTSPVILGRCSKETKPVEIKNSGEKDIQLFIDNTVHGGPLQNISNNTPHISGSIGILSIDMTGIQDFISEAEKLKMLRGGSSIVDDTLKRATNIISNNVCKEAVLFTGGGNLLSFIPNNARFSLCEEIKNEIRNKSHNGLKAAVISFEASLDDIGWKFETIIKKSQDKLVIEKNRTNKGMVLKKTKHVCKYCFKREEKCTYKYDKMCEVCYIKIKTGYEKKSKNSEEYIPKIPELERPTELEHIGNSIAAIAIDGNMMGRMFQQTNTPAEYAYKSQTFSTKFEDIIRSTIKNFLNNLENQKLIKHKHKEKNHLGKHEVKNYLGIDVLYVGGDDVLIIMNAKGAVRFSEMLVNNIAEKFTFNMKFHTDITFKNPIVTISCGIAIANSKFPIYFLLNAARSMESKAKEKFRCETETDDFGLINVTKGAIAFTAISSAMPNNEFCAFVLTDDNLIDDQNLLKLNNIIDLALKENENYRAFVADIITCGPSDQEHLNLIKFMYSSIKRKTNITDLDHYELMAEVLLNDELLKASQMIIPHLWHDSEEELI
jgi:hypothetical protein